MDDLSFSSRIMVDRLIIFTSGVVFSLVAQIPDSLITSDLKFYVIIFILIITFIYVGGKQFYRDYKHNLLISTKFGFLQNVLPHLIHVKYETVYTKLQENGDMERIRTFNIVNYQKEILTHFSIPIYYDIYDLNKKQDYLPKVKEILINGEPLELNRKFFREEGTIIKSDETYEGRGWIVIPLNLKSEDSVDIVLKIEQKHLFKNLFIEERAGVVITLPTDQLRIIVKAPEGKIIQSGFEFEKPIEIKYNILNMIDHEELERVKSPSFSNGEAEWIINNPKIGDFYRLVFKVE